MKRGLLLLGILLTGIMGLCSCATTAELESKIKQLEDENQRLLTEIQQLEDENQQLLIEKRELGTEPTTTITEAQAAIMVFERLTNLAQTIEAKEYVGAFLHLPTSEIHYEAETKCWYIEINGWQTESIETRDWFPDPDDPINFKDDHWDNTIWLVFDDGRILPFGGGLTVEADIDRLNSYRTLR